MSGFVVLAVVAAPSSDTGGGECVTSSGRVDLLENVRIARAAGLEVAVRAIESQPRVSAGELRSQDAAVRALAARWAAVLPFRFGTVVASEGELGEKLGPLEAVLRDGLARVSGKEQWTVRVLAAIDAEPGARRAGEQGLGETDHSKLNGISRSVSSESPATAPTPAAELNGISPSDPAARPALGPGARYLAERARIRSGAALPGVAALERAVGALAHATKVEPHDTPGLVASVYHLVARADAATYRRAVASLEPALRLRVSGPFPPYAFVPASLA